MIWWMVLSMSMPSTCTPIEADHIVAADLARAVPEFSAAPPAAEIGYAPAPGVRRVIRIDELRRLATRFNVRLTSEREVCFAWPLAPVSANDAAAAMKKSLGAPQANIQVVQLSNRAAPHGELVFPLPGLIPPADRRTGPALWRGYVSYAGSRRFDLWAKVKISAPTTRVVASSDIAAGRVIQAADVRLETIDDFPVWKQVARQLDEVVGHIAQRGIQKGRAVLRTEVSEPVAVSAGEIVHVDVESGRAHIKLDALAESSGRTGDMIRLRNPRSGKYFRARVEGKGKVLVMPDIAGGVLN